MQEFKIFALEEVKDYIWLIQEAWGRVRQAPKKEYVQALRRELAWPEEE